MYYVITTKGPFKGPYSRAIATLSKFIYLILNPGQTATIVKVNSSVN